MTERDAIQLITAGVTEKPPFSTWADLGSGSGTFTKALAHLLGNSSSILAVDKESQRIDSPTSEVKIQFLQADFTKITLPTDLDGIIIANALHYVKHQHDFVTGLVRHLKSTGRILFIEYDTRQSNTWIPYPIPYVQLRKLLLNAGFKSVDKIGERSSIYREDKLYACLALV